MLIRTNVVIITYNALEYTKATIESLFLNTDSDFYLTVVDNYSNSDTHRYLDSLRPTDFCKKISIIKNLDNMGVGYAYNQGQEVSFNLGVEFTAFCNNDLYFSKSWLKRLEDRMDQETNVAMLCPLRPSAKVMYDSTISTRDRLMGMPEVSDWTEELELYSGFPVDKFNEFSNKIVSANGGALVEKIAFPDSLSTCVCLTRNSVFQKIGYFADPILAHSYGGEDIDMCWSVMKLGYDCAVDHGVYIHHFRGKSLKSNDMDRVKLLRTSNRILYSKWRDDIHKLIEDKTANNEDVISNIRTPNNSKYWLLHELDMSIGFTEKYVK